VAVVTEAGNVAALTLPQQLRYWAQVRPGETALQQKDYGIWEPVTWARYEQQARWFGLGLAKLGLPQHGHCAIISENRKEWVFTQLGCGLVGAVAVGVYPTSPAPEIEYLLHSADASVVLHSVWNLSGCWRESPSAGCRERSWSR
jgi:long-chain acyl-CoA synthetase